MSPLNRSRCLCNTSATAPVAVKKKDLKTALPFGMLSCIIKPIPAHLWLDLQRSENPPFSNYPQNSSLPRLASLSGEVEGWKKQAERDWDSQLAREAEEGLGYI